MSSDTNAVSAKLARWREDGRVNWLSGVRSVQAPTITKITEPSVAVQASITQWTGETASPLLPLEEMTPWWMPGIYSVLTEPRTNSSSFGVSGYIWLHRSELAVTEYCPLNIQLLSKVGDDLLTSLASFSLSSPQDLEHVARTCTLGLQDAIEWLTTSDSETLTQWALGEDLLLKRIATSHPGADGATQVLGYLQRMSEHSLEFPLLPASAFRLSRAFVSSYLCTSLLLKIDRAQK